MWIERNCRNKYRRVKWKQDYRWIGATSGCPYWHTVTYKQIWWKNNMDARYCELFLRESRIGSSPHLLIYPFDAIEMHQMERSTGSMWPTCVQCTRVHVHLIASNICIAIKNTLGKNKLYTNRTYRRRNEEAWIVLGTRKNHPDKTNKITQISWA